jgi:hypothetical protein
MNEANDIVSHGLTFFSTYICCGGCSDDVGRAAADSFRLQVRVCRAHRLLFQQCCIQCGGAFRNL